MAADYRIARVGDGFELQARTPFGWLSLYEPQDTQAECERAYIRICDGEAPDGN